MSRYTVNNVVDRLWNDSGDEEDISVMILTREVKKNTAMTPKIHCKIWSAHG